MNAFVRNTLALAGLLLASLTPVHATSVKLLEKTFSMGGDGSGYLTDKEYTTVGVSLMGSAYADLVLKVFEQNLGQTLVVFPDQVADEWYPDQEDGFYPNCASFEDVMTNGVDDTVIFWGASTGYGHYESLIWDYRNPALTGPDMAGYVIDFVTFTVNEIDLGIPEYWTPGTNRWSIYTLDITVTFWGHEE